MNQIQYACVRVHHREVQNLLPSITRQSCKGIPYFVAVDMRRNKSPIIGLIGVVDAHKLRYCTHTIVKVIVATLLAVVFAVHLVMAVNVRQRAQSAVTPTKIAVKSAWVQAQRHGHPKDICSVNAPLLLIESLTQARSGGEKLKRAML